MISEGSKVRIIPSDKTGMVLEVKDSFANVSCNGTAAWHPASDLSELDDALLNRLMNNEADDPTDFVLAMDAYRLYTAQTWDPYVLATSNRIQVFPHQVDEVTWALDNQRTLIADEVGLGKTIIAALVATEQRARGVVKKALYVVPKSLILKWKDELEERFDADVTILGSSHERVTPETFKRDTFSYIASIDYLKQEHIMDMFNNSNLDLVVIDEAHKMKKKTQRLKCGKLLADKSNIIMLLTATPHDGRDDDFMERMLLLDPYVLDIPSSSHLWVRNIKEDILDIEGNTVFPPRKSETMKLGLTDDEVEVHNMLDSYMRKRREEATTQQEYNAVRFLSIIFRKRCSSSMKALEKSLKKRKEKLGNVDAETVVKNHAGARDAEDDHDEETYDKAAGNVEGYTATKDMGQEKSDLDRLIGAIEKLSGVDSKRSELMKFIRNRKKDYPKAKLILFTEYRDTLESLSDELSKRYRVGRIDGTMTIEERKKSLDSFRNPEGEEILLCTDAAGEGIDMQFCNVEINYDLPWNPNKLEQRMGRIHRIGQDQEVYYYNFIVEQSIDGYIMARLMEKIESIKEALSDRVYDILGRIVTEDDIARIYEELVKTPASEWESTMAGMLEDINKKKEQALRMDEHMLTAHKFDRSKLEDIQKFNKSAIDKGEVKRFMDVYLNTHDGRYEKLDGMKDMYSIGLPREAASLVDRPLVQGTFDRETSLKNSVPYLALGNKHVSALVQYAAKPSVAYLKHPTRSGLLSVYRLSVQNGKGLEQNVKIICLFQNEDGVITEMDTRSIWSYQESEEGGINTDKLTGFSERSTEHTRGILDGFKEDSMKKIDKIKMSSINIATSYFTKQIAELVKKINELKPRIAESPHVEHSIKKHERKMREYQQKRDERLKKIRDEFRVKGVMELVGLAWITPDMDASTTNAVGKAGEMAVIKYEMSRATSEDEKNVIKDVSARDTGYDVESFGGRCIEVKSFKKSGSPHVTSHEWETAARLGDDYWLYIVENALDDHPKITVFQNMYDTFKDMAKMEEVKDRRYVIEGWKDSLGYSRPT